MERPDEFSYHELMDRLSWLAEIAERLEEHSVARYEPVASAAIYSAVEALGKAYSDVARLRFALFPHDDGNAAAAMAGDEAG